MKQFSLLAAVLLAPVVALAQTYVRPSKGAAFDPFGGQTIGSLSSSVSNIYDWTAFTSARIQVFGTGAGTNGAGIQCASVTPIDYTFNNLNSFIRVGVQRVGTQTDLYVISAGRKEGPFITEFQDGQYAVTRYESGVSSYEKFGNCNVTVLVTPLPFEDVIAAKSNVSPTVAPSSTQGYACTPGTESRETQVLSATAWTKINAGTVSTTVCNSPLNQFGLVYCVVHDLANQGALPTPPNTLIPSAYVLLPGECQQFGPSRSLSAAGWTVDLPVPWCAAADAAASVGVRTCAEARINN